MLTASERVERGAQFLDGVVPGWPALIDTEALDIGSVSDCVLGQLAPAMWEQVTCMHEGSIHNLSPFGWWMYDICAPADASRQVFTFGFDGDEDVSDDQTYLVDSGELTEVWRQVITAKRAALV